MRNKELHFSLTNICSVVTKKTTYQFITEKRLKTEEGAKQKNKPLVMIPRMLMMRNRDGIYLSKNQVIPIDQEPISSRSAYSQYSGTHVHVLESEDTHSTISVGEHGQEPQTLAIYSGNIADLGTETTNEVTTVGCITHQRTTTRSRSLGNVFAASGAHNANPHRKNSVIVVASSTPFTVSPTEQIIETARETPTAGK